jgi:hypothetical protein
MKRQDKVLVDDYQLTMKRFFCNLTSALEVRKASTKAAKNLFYRK